MVRTKIIIAIVAVILVVVVGFQNTEGVDATVLFFTGNIPLVALLLMSFVVGVIAGLLIALAVGGRRKVTEGDT